MSFLAPLYVAGLLAVSLPILFHLIRRTPRGRTDFSSLMFLSPSPPRITRRSRLNNIVLLLLRAAALALLAFAFARPFLRREARADADRGKGRRVAIMLDTSASMRRGDLWRRAVASANEVVDGLTPADEAALYFFDRTARPAMTFAEWNELDHPRRLAALRARLAEASPTWDSTRLGDCLAVVGEVLGESDTRREEAIHGASRLLVCITDMQDGAHADSLQAHQWPPSVVLDVRPVTLKHNSNASVHLATDAEAAEADPTRLRVRVVNAPDSTRDNFSLAWQSDRGPLPNADPVKVYVPPGHTQTVRVPWPAPDAKADRLVLSGDDEPFDDTLYVVPPRKDAARVAYLGDDGPDDTRGLRYYLDSALVETPRRKVGVTARKSAEPLTDADLTGTRLAVVTTGATDDRAARLKTFVESGGDVLWVLKEAAAAQGLAAVFGGTPTIEEPPKRDFALLARIDTGHPLFAPFGEARFADFSRIHFWHHRRLKLDDSTGSRVLAAFDDGDPFLVERAIGKGRLYVMTSGWQPSDSQLALSTKFVPLIAGLLRRDDGADVQAQYTVNDPLALPPPASSGDAPRLSLRTPDGRQVQLAGGARTFDGATEPGIYRLSLKDREIPIAVNLSPDESRTAPQGVEELEQWGAKLGATAAPEEVAARQRQLQVIELENRQKLWRWLIVAVIGFLFAETALAGGLTRRALRGQPETP